jgi:NADPH:quinone reductase-like Zn-dependent oxidoreductase
MRAVVQHGYGAAAAEVLTVADCPVPLVGADEVLVRVTASSVDRGTWHLMAGLPLLARLESGVRAPKRLNPGRCVAGTVAAVGADVTTFRVGDRVCGSGNGAFAECAAVKIRRLAPVPERVGLGEAATLPVSGVTALQAVRDVARVGPGARVLVLGASGGVGTFAVQVARALGGRVTGVCSAAKADVVRDLGAERVLDYAADDLADGTRYDAVIDIGGRRTLTELRHLLAPRGTLVVVGGEGRGRWLGGFDRGFRALALSPFVGPRLRQLVSRENAEDLAALIDLVAAGEVRPVVERSFPLAETAAAIDHVAEGRARGKVVIEV